ncbi:hypothetical protein [Roseibium sp. Sym1]|uniref:hypothetical protein n=1 Tax=Roseibium sp. Sym1 TaxID=3016006 RepID=UPI0022B5E3D3|nr:hypothetical protein [Roseibium sp. Sym1]
MKVVFWHSDKDLDRRLAWAVVLGAKVHGDEAVAIPSELYNGAVDHDVACMLGVKTQKLFKRHQAAGRQIVYFDKGYIRDQIPGVSERECKYWRVAVNDHHPTKYLMDLSAPVDRFEDLKITPREWRDSGDHVLYAGSSAKYHEFAGLPHPTKYVHKLVRRIRKLSNRPIIYRPKPSWKEAVEIEGVEFSTAPERIRQVLDRSHVLITNGSNSCFDAMVSGIPSIILGQAVAAPISSHSLEDIEEPKLASESDRLQWFSNLAYCQWTLDELRSGEAWGHLRKLLLNGKI